MKCEELLAMLNEYIDGSASPAICHQFESHLAGCNPCQIVVDTVRKTIALYQQGERYDLPAAFQRKLHAALRQQWKETHPPR